MNNVSILILSESLTGQLLDEYFTGSSEYSSKLISLDHFQELEKNQDFSNTILLVDASSAGVIDCLENECGNKDLIPLFRSSALFNAVKNSNEEQLAIKCGFKGIFYFDEVIKNFKREIDYLIDGGIRVNKKLLFDIMHSTKLEEDKTYEEIQSEMLTNRENEILNEVRKGLTNKEIAYQMFISEATVKRHMSNIFEKIGIHDRRKVIKEFIGTKM
ncbi:helix-turn-helix transcriptional regulator [Spirochaeta isovalerica]|uniref:DNA-binding CsgD family transcriptional regulator n=1 Tax=Spirochaeta isovalerica TaxID=150 RepID=A0A841R6Y3_9SPIO|nr:LuxR C-terminal-related transcriptional regulator [Spirochaeta isovalerica]MBB6479596.1 DNA-binding CsgD family transcriptional regulator [Spirochaeta isovalerica]